MTNPAPFSTMTYNDATSELTSSNSSGGTDLVTPGASVNYGYGEGFAFVILRFNTFTGLIQPKAHQQMMFICLIQQR